jgi:hypothetical protein
VGIPETRWGRRNRGDGNRGTATAATSVSGNNVNNGNINAGNNVQMSISMAVTAAGVAVGGGYYHPIAAGIAIGAVAATTMRRLIGSYYYALPAQLCFVLARGYYHCGSVYYSRPGRATTSSTLLSMTRRNQAACHHRYREAIREQQERIQPKQIQELRTCAPPRTQ